MFLNIERSVNCSRWCPLCYIFKLLFADAFFALDQSDVVSLEHYSSQLLLCMSLHVALAGIIQNQIHVLIKTNNLSLYPCVHILVQPDNYPGSVLEISKNVMILKKTAKFIVIFLPENEVYRLHHHLLNFLTATVGHFALVIKTYSVKKNNYWWCKRFVGKAETHQIWTFSQNSILTSFHTISSQQKSQFRHWKKSITARI